MSSLRCLLLLAVCLFVCACGDESAGDGPDAPDYSDVVADPLGEDPARSVDNVLLVLLEDMGPQIGAYATPGVTTPNLDAFAAQGARYERAYVTLATCSASKAALLTGYYNHSTGAVHNVQEFIGSAEALEAANPAWLHDPGSAYNAYAIADRFPTLIERLAELGLFTGVQNKFHVAPHDKFPYDRWYAHSRDDYGQVRSFIDDAQVEGRPWFLLHAISDPHRPFPDSAEVPLDVDPGAVEPPAHLLDDEVVRRDWAEYLQAIQNADARVGETLRALDDAGAADDTLVIVIGDHGPAYHRGKFTTYNLGLQVPLLVRGPRIAPGSVREELFSGVDLTPTIMWFLGRAIGSQGIAHGPWLTGQRSDAPRDVLVGQAASDRSISDGRYHLIHAPNPADTVMPADNRDAEPWGNAVYGHIRNHADAPGFAEAYRFLDLADATLPRFARPAFELYDLQQDPWEIHDLQDDPAHAGDLQRLRGELADWMERYGDPAPRP